MRNTADVTGGKPIAVLLQSMSGVSAINPLIAFYDIHGGKREVLFFYFVPDFSGFFVFKVIKYCAFSAWYKLVLRVDLNYSPYKILQNPWKLPAVCTISQYSQM
jgi:hypothetical protein